MGRALTQQDADAHAGQRAAALTRQLLAFSRQQILRTQPIALNVRVIDRNNRPISNMQKDEFRVYEDGVAQPRHHHPLQPLDEQTLVDSVKKTTRCDSSTSGFSAIILPMRMPASLVTMTAPAGSARPARWARSWSRARTGRRR